MKRAALIAALALALTGCGGGEVADYNEAVKVGPFADWDQEALDSLGESACEDITDNGMAAYTAIENELEAQGMSSDQATRAMAAFVVRFCPEVAA